MTPTLLPLEPRTVPSVVTYAAGVLTLPTGATVGVLSGFPGPGDVATDGELTVVGAGVGGGPVVQVYDAAGGLVSSFYAFGEGFRGGVQVGVDADGIRVVPAPGSGGGPVLRTFDPLGTLLSSVWVGPESNRDGVYLGAGSRGPVADAAGAAGGVPLDLSRLGVRFVGGVDPTAGQWQRLRDSLSLLPPAAFRLLIAGGSSIDVTNGVPITTRPGLAPGTPGLYGPVDGLAGVGDPLVIRLDEQPNGSADYILHEIWHQIDKLLGYPSRSAPWLFRHATTPNWPSEYEATYPAEALAESGARLGRGLPQPDDRIAPFLVALLDGIGV